MSHTEAVFALQRHPAENQSKAACGAATRTEPAHTNTIPVTICIIVVAHVRGAVIQNFGTAIDQGNAPCNCELQEQMKAANAW